MILGIVILDLWWTTTCQRQTPACRWRHPPSLPRPTIGPLDDPSIADSGAAAAADLPLEPATAEGVPDTAAADVPLPGETLETTTDEAGGVEPRAPELVASAAADPTAAPLGDQPALDTGGQRRGGCHSWRPRHVRASHDGCRNGFGG